MVCFFIVFGMFLNRHRGVFTTAVTGLSDCQGQVRILALRL
jgi:hypothetical protein